VRARITALRPFSRLLHLSARSCIRCMRTSVARRRRSASTARAECRLPIRASRRVQGFPVIFVSHHDRGFNAGSTPATSRVQAWRIGPAASGDRQDVRTGGSRPAELQPTKEADAEADTVEDDAPATNPVSGPTAKRVIARNAAEQRNARTPRPGTQCSEGQRAEGRRTARAPHRG